jgi:uncharacterized protein (TIGR02246 family)
MQKLSLVLAVLCVASAGCANRPPDLAADLAAIDSLHQKDMAAAPAGDIDALMALWSDDPVALPPDGPILEGREVIRAMLEAGRRKADSPWEPMEYTQHFTEVKVLGDYGWDLGTVTSRLVNRDDGRELVVNGKLLRILKREPDGRWTVYRSMWNQEPPVVREGGGG